MMRYFTQSKNLPNVVECWQNHGVKSILDSLHEASTCYQDSERSTKTIINTIQILKPEFHAVKLSSLGLDYSYQDAQKNFIRILEEAEKVGTDILLDAEDINRQGKIDLMYYQLSSDHRFYNTYQMYRKDSMENLSLALVDTIHKSEFFGAKLVRGAYYNLDKGSGLLYETKKETDHNFNNGIQLLAEYDYPNVDVMLATHNNDSINLGMNLSKNFKYAHLLGFQNKKTKDLAQNCDMYKYIPYGPIIHAGPYLVRRLFENLDMVKNIV